MSPKDATASLSPAEDPMQQDVSDEDDLSITSTNPPENDTEKDWEVDDIVAEREHPDIPGASQYLIQWEGFKLEDCTWEPVENLGDGLLEKWEENKAEIEAGAREPFDLEKYETACNGRAHRHMRRNAKRQRLGLPLTPPFPPGLASDIPMASPSDQYLSSSEEEARGIDDVDPASIPLSKPKVTASTEIPPSVAAAPKAAPTAHRVPKQTTFIGIPSQAPQKGSITPRTLGKSQDQQLPPPFPKTSAKPSASVAASGSSASATSKPIRKGVGGTMTGYQGTAGRKSAFRPNTAKTTPNASSVVTNRVSPTTTKPSSPSSIPTNDSQTKRLTATRTRQSAASAPTNVFAGGEKARKKRANLADVMGDPSKTPKHFTSFRKANLARKRGVEKGDVVGALSSIPSRLIIGNELPSTGQRKSSLDSPTTITSPHEKVISNQPLATSVSVPTPLASGETTHQGVVEGPSKLKRKKSVRFTGADDDALASTVDDLFGDTPQQDPTVKSPITDKGLTTPSISLAAYQERGQTQTIQKHVKFGNGEAILVNFNGITRHSAAWLAAFKAEEPLHLKTTCSSFHFIIQKLQLIEEKLSAGPIEPTLPEHAVALRNVAVALQRTSIGLHLAAREYSILVYSESNEWDSLDVGAKKPNADVTLRYLIYRSPINPRAYPYNESKALNNLLHPNKMNHPEVVGLLTGLSFDTLLPQDLKFTSRQVYMLLIPLKARQLLGVLMAWIRIHQPDRPILTVEQPNSWRLFHEAVQAGAGGTIICHADFTLWKLEKIPHLWRMLEDGKYTFWNLDTGENKRPQYPSDMDAISIPGTLRLTRLFPYGRAFLITPSFVISEPAKLCTFLKWFLQFGRNPGFIVVACHDFPRFLRDVAEEKQKEHHALTRLNPNNKDVYEFFDRAGRSQRDIDDHFRAWQLLQEIMEVYGDEETSEDVRKVHWLSELVDQSDEQSLVNAFCWWTQLKCDRFRRFYVLGSDPNKIQRAYRYIDIPRYFDTEGSDPDIAGILTQRRLFAAELQKEADKNGTQANIAWDIDSVVDGLPKIIGEWRNSVSEPAFPFPGTLFSTGSVQEIQRWLDGHRAATGMNWSVLHTKPVSWTDQNMAAQFRDEYTNHFDSFSSWLGAAPQFTKARNTFYGLFYTITDTWDEYMPKRKYERHPWLAICRPKNPHFITPNGMFKTIELFIWDIAIADRERFGHTLLDMQCQLIDYVYENITKYYPGHALSDVWYSSANNLQFSPHANALDITCQRITEMFNNVRSELPPRDTLLREKWTAIDPRAWSAGMSPITLRSRPVGKASELALKRIPQTEEDKLKPEKMIWHPVRRGIKGHGTKCLNDLHETCLRARLRDPQCGQICYKYRPTLEWWADQVAEGRGYGYVCVDVAGRIIDRLPKTK